MEHFLPENSGAVTSAKNFQNNSIPLNPIINGNIIPMGWVKFVQYYITTKLIFHELYPLISL